MPTPLVSERASAGSLTRRLAFGGAAMYAADCLATVEPFRRIAVLGDWATLRIPAHAARLAFDALECLRTASWVPSFGNVDRALFETAEPLEQPPRYRAFWYDAAAHAMTGIHVGVDLIRSEGRYFVLENNTGPSIYDRRRALYDAPFDPLVSQLAETAKEHGFRRVVPLAWRWSRAYLQELGRAGNELGVPIEPFTCPLRQPEGAPSAITLPPRLERDTMYVIHSGLTAPAIRYIDHKWHSHRWLSAAIAQDWPAGGAPIALPRTQTELAGALGETSPRWPNLVVKLADSDRSRHVIAGRFAGEAEARRALGLNGLIEIPRGLRAGFARSLLFGKDLVLYQQFVPPELDRRGHARMIRLHLLLTPLRASFVSAHYRISRGPVPERAPAGVIRLDDAYVFNDADYERIPSEQEEELRQIAELLGAAMQRALAKKLVTGMP